MVLVLCLTIIFMVIITLICSPLFYETTLYIGSPCSFRSTIHWFGRFFYYDWTYTYGKQPHSSSRLGWKKREMQAPSIQLKTAPEQSFKTEDILKDLEREDTGLSYKDIKDAAPRHSKQSDSHFFWWKPLITSQTFITAFCIFLGRLLYHSRIRRLSLEGTLGLSRPHETGILAGALYAIIPTNIRTLHFNFIEERYDCTFHAAGHIYPAALIFYTAAFLLSSPVRCILLQWHKTRKEEDHG